MPPWGVGGHGPRESPCRDSACPGASAEPAEVARAKSRWGRRCRQGLGPRAPDPPCHRRGPRGPGLPLRRLGDAGDGDARLRVCTTFCSVSHASVRISRGCLSAPTVGRVTLSVPSGTRAPDHFLAVELGPHDLSGRPRGLVGPRRGEEGGPSRRRRWEQSQTHFQGSGGQGTGGSSVQGGLGQGSRGSSVLSRPCRWPWLCFRRSPAWLSTVLRVGWMPTRPHGPFADQIRCSQRSWPT